MKLQRAIGQTSQILNLFVQDTTVSTGAGLANIPATTVSYTWFHNNQAVASTGVAVSTASMGTYTSGAWTQISSSLALGWYQFGLPDGALATGDAVGVHVYVSTGAFAMAPLPIEIELVRDNPQQFASSKVFLAYTSTSPANVVQAQGQNVVTSASGQFQVSTQAVDKTGYIVNVSSWANSTVVATSSGVVDVNLVNIWNKSAVTSASGQLQVSTQSLVGIVVSTQSLVGITTAANVIQAYGSAIVTSASGQFRVSTQSLVGIIVSTQSLAGITVDIGTVYAQPLVTSGAGILNVSTQQLPAAGAGDITTIYGQPIVTSAAGILDINIKNIVNSAAVTSGAGILNVSTQAIDKGGYGVTTVAAAVTTNANVIQAYGSAIVTSASGQFRVSTQAIDKGGYGVTTIAATITTNANILQAYGSAIVTSGAGILNVSTQTLAAGAGDVISVYGQPIVTTAAGVIRVSTQSLVGIVVSTQAIDKGGYGVTTNADKTGYTLTAGDKAAMMAVISSTTISESYRASSDIASIPQLMYEMLANVTDFANSGTTRALNSVTSHAAGSVQYQYDSTTPSSITRIA